MFAVAFLVLFTHSLLRTSVVLLQLLFTAPLNHRLIVLLAVAFMIPFMVPAPLVFSI